jgi:phosphocarrier protein HPr
MVERYTTIRNKDGFHIRPAQLFVEKAAQFQATIELVTEEPAARIDGKSILGLMTLGLEKGKTLRIIAEGPDEEAAVSALSELVESGFGES